jgi:hypothetical protein
VAEIPENVTLADGFVAAPARQLWPRLAELAGWADLFPGWIASINADDDHFTATGPNGQRFDLYPQIDAEMFAADVEVVDELGSADTLRLRVVEVNGGSFVLVAHGRLKGTPQSEWDAKRAAIADALSALPVS